MKKQGSINFDPRSTNKRPRKWIKTDSEIGLKFWSLSRSFIGRTWIKIYHANSSFKCQYGSILAFEWRIGMQLFDPRNQSTAEKMIKIWDRFPNQFCSRDRFETTMRALTNFPPDHLVKSSFSEIGLISEKMVMNRINHIIWSIL